MSFDPFDQDITYNGDVCFVGNYFRQSPSWTDLVLPNMNAVRTASANTFEKETDHDKKPHSEDQAMNSAQAQDAYRSESVGD